MRFHADCSTLILLSVPLSRSAEPITGPPWVVRKLRDHADISACLGHPAFTVESVSTCSRCPVRPFCLCRKICQKSWIKGKPQNSSLPSGRAFLAILRSRVGRPHRDWVSDNSAFTIHVLYWQLRR